MTIIQMQHNTGCEAKGIRIEPTPALYSFLKEVQTEVRPQAGRKIPLADILTKFAMMSITSIGNVSDAARVLLTNQQPQINSTPAAIPVPQYVSTSTASQNVQNIWETVEEMQATNGISSKARNEAQDERREQEQAEQPKRLSAINSANVYSYESYAREYLDNYHYCMDMLMAEASKQVQAGEAEQVITAAGHVQPVNDQAAHPILWETVDKYSLKLDEELLPDYFPDLYEDDEEGEDIEQEQEPVQDQEKEQAILRIVHSLRDHKLKEEQAATTQPRHDQQPAITEKQNVQNEKVSLRDNPFFREFLKLEEVSTPATPQEPSEEEKRKAEEHAKRQAEIERCYTHYSRGLVQRIIYIIKREGIDGFLQSLKYNHVLASNEIRDNKISPALTTAIVAAFGSNYGEQWIFKGEQPGTKVCKEDFYNLHMELTKAKQK